MRGNGRNNGGNHSHELSVAQVAADFNKTRMTIFRWVKSGFILTLGYRVRVGPKGDVHLTPPPTPRDFSSQL
jgi:hypothetical protein